MHEWPDLTIDGRGLVVFIHGTGLPAQSWAPWLKLFARNGYDGVAVLWPGEASTPASCRAQSERRASLTVNEISDHVAVCITSHGRVPIAIGHNAGALVAETLLERALASAAVALAPPYPRLAAGVWRRLHAGPSGLTTTDRQPSAMPTGPEFHRTFATAPGFSESEALRARPAAPATSGSAMRARAAAPARRSASTEETGVRGPLLLISGGRDVMAPEQWVNDLHIWHRRNSPDAVTDHQVFPGRGHSMVIDAGWRDIAEYTLDWLTRQNQ